MLRIITNILGTLLLLGLWPFLLVFGLLKGENIAHRLGFWGIFPERPIWIHSASLGEARVALLFAELIRKRVTDVPILFTASTKSGFNAIASRNLQNSHVRTLFLDHPLIARTVIKRLKPKVLFIAETELWFNLLAEAKRSNVPVHVINGRMSDRTLNFVNTIYPSFWKAIANFLMIDEQGRERLLEIGVPSGAIRVAGNIKSAFVPGKGEAQTPGFLTEAALVTFGSVRSKEENEIIDIVRHLCDKYQEHVWIIAPRHLERVDSVLKKLAGMDVSLLSHGKLSRVIVVDVFGKLLGLYSQSVVAFVGGTLHDYGGHNPLEPACFGIPVLFGPDVSSNPIVFNQLIKDGGGEMANNGPELQKIIDRLLSGPDECRVMGEKAKKALEILSKSRQNYMDFIDEIFRGEVQ